MLTFVNERKVELDPGSLELSRDPDPVPGVQPSAYGKPFTGGGLAWASKTSSSMKPSDELPS